MKKLLILIAVLIAVAVGVYVMKGDKELDLNSPIDSLFGSSDNALLEYVPADTVFFVGTVNPVDMEKSLGLMKSMGFDMDSMYGADILKELEAEMDTDDMPAGVKFGFSLYMDYVENLKDMSSEKVNMAFYTVGVLPVVRFEVADVAAFNAKVTEAESKNNITPLVNTFGEVEYREYELDEDGMVTLVVSVSGNMVTMSMNTPLADDQDVQKFLSKPAKSIADSGRLNDLMNKHGYLGYGLFFMDNKAITEGMTNPKANDFGDMLNQFMTMSGENPLADIQTPACQAELPAFVGTWPMMSADYTELTDTSMSYKFAIDSSNSDLMESLQRLRGHLSPNVTGQDYTMSMSLGLNVDQLAPVLTDVWTRLTADTYNCAPLADMQAELKQNNPMMLSMMTGMIAGIKGVSFGVKDVDVAAISANPDAAMESANVFASLSAENPASLLATLANFQPELGGLSVEDGAAPADLPMPIPAKMALRGHDFIVSMGPEAVAMIDDAGSNSDLEINGLMSFEMDFGVYMQALIELMESQGAMQYMEESDKKAMEKMKNVNGVMHASMDLTENGFESTSTFTVKK